MLHFDHHLRAVLKTDRTEPSFWLGRPAESSSPAPSPARRWGPAARCGARIRPRVSAPPQVAVAVIRLVQCHAGEVLPWTSARLTWSGLRRGLVDGVATGRAAAPSVNDARIFRRVRAH